MSNLDLYKFICENSDNNFKEKFVEEDLLFLIGYHSHNKDGFLSFTDFNQMVLPTCHPKLRAEATQRVNIYPEQQN